MYCFSIGFCDNTQVFSEFRNQSPMANTSIRLNLFTLRMVENVLNPFDLKIRPANPNAGLKVIRRFHLFGGGDYTITQETGK